MVADRSAEQPRVRWPVLVLIVCALALAGAGCGGDDEEEAPTPTAEQPATEETAPEDEGEDGGVAGLPEGTANAGEQVFTDTCASCHGEDGGGVTAPSLQNPELADDPDRVAQQVINGGGGMPAFGDQLSDQQIADVVAYVTEDIAQR